MSRELSPELMDIAERRIREVFGQCMDTLDVREKITAMYLESLNSEFPAVRAYAKVSMRLSVSAAGILVVAPAVIFHHAGEPARIIKKFEPEQFDIAAGLFKPTKGRMS